MVNIGVLGHGVVGSGVVELLIKNQDSIKRKTGGVGINVKYILDKRDFSGTGYDDKFTKNFDDILEDQDVKIVVEVMGGVNPAFDFVKRCMQAGKHVVTSNKELVAAKGDQLLAIGREYNVSFLFEASVGGGIPIIRPLHQCLAANEISEIVGILNGTSNYILTKMFKDGMPFEQALETAQKLGYAERDPSADVGGHDACRKICILASLAFGKHIYPEDTVTEGISNITAEDVKYAEVWGGVIKLIARAKLLDNGKVFIKTGPAMVSDSGQLFNVDDVFNGILVRGDAIGDVVFYGKGAGKFPTASAVVADIIDQTKHIGSNPKRLFWGPAEKGFVEDIMQCSERQYIRASFATKSIGEKTVKELFGEVQYLYLPGQDDNVIAFVTDEIPYAKLNASLSIINTEGRVISNFAVLSY